MTIYSITIETKCKRILNESNGSSPINPNALAKVSESDRMNIIRTNQLNESAIWKSETTSYCNPTPSMEEETWAIPTNFGNPHPQPIIMINQPNRILDEIIKVIEK